MGVPSQRKWDTIHAENITKYERKVKAAYRKAIDEVSKIAVGTNLNTNEQFFFRNNPDISKKVNSVLKSLNSQIYGTTVTGINSEWDLAVEKNNELAQYVYGNNLEDLPIEYRDKYFSNNAIARNNFIQRKDVGLKLSDKVWNNTKQFKTELELALEVGIGSGKSAASIARDTKQFLNDPNELYRRVASKKGGVLRLSQAAKAYNPGRGRYRSSYKNAKRLAANETNFSYEGSQALKRKEQDFIVGIEIHTSPRHKASDDNGGISCIALQGKYPKDFNWTYKWHVNCRCYSLNILKTRAELDSDIDRILAGKEPTTVSANKVTYVSKSYRNYLNANKNKWSKWSNQPRTFEANKGLFKTEPTKTVVKKVFNFNDFTKDYIDYNPEYAKQLEAGVRNSVAKNTARTAYEKDQVNVAEYLSNNRGTLESLRGYTGTGYTNIRRLNTYGDIAPNSYTSIEVYKQSVKNITDFIEANPIKENLKLYRKVKGDEMIKIFNDLKKGAIFEDKSFMSTATLPQSGFGSYEIEIYAKAGSKIACADNGYELEYLAQKGSKYKVIKKEEHKIFLQLL